jgi:hypothetical protein
MSKQQGDNTLFTDELGDSVRTNFINNVTEREAPVRQFQQEQRRDTWLEEIKAEQQKAQQQQL